MWITTNLRQQVAVEASQASSHQIETTTGNTNGSEDGENESGNEESIFHMNKYNIAKGQ